jgi:HK97 family phage portal protein
VSDYVPTPSGLFVRSSSFDEAPNANDPATVPPASVGPPAAVPGDPDSLVLISDGPPTQGFPSSIRPSAWSGWPDEWDTPNWSTHQLDALTDIAWACLDLNSSLLSTMPPYLVGAADSLASSWLANPDPDFYASWEEFAKQLFWDFQLGEAFIVTTARYSTNQPARFHVVPPWFVTAEMVDGLRRYAIGALDVTDDMLHIRYKSTTGFARGIGPLEVGQGRLVAAQVLSRYATNFARAGGVPNSILKYPGELSDTQAEDLQAKWVAARISRMGLPAVLSGGVDFAVLQLNPKDMALVELLQLTESRISVLLGVPPFIMGLPSGGDHFTYKNVTSIFDFHWRAGLRPKATAVMSAFSNWVVPRGTRVELNRDSYIQPEPLERAQTAQILNGIVDPQTGQPAMTVEEIRMAERLENSTPTDLSAGVLRG